MQDIVQLLRFVTVNSKLQDKLKNKDYGKVEDHLDALDSVKTYMPEVINAEQQVHLGLLMAHMIQSSNNPAAMQRIKDAVDKKWSFVRNPDYPNSKVPQYSHYAPGNILSFVVGCSRDPYFHGELLDNPRCAEQFRDDIIEKIHHKTMPVYVDVDGNMKVFYEGDTDMCNIFMEDDSLQIAVNSWKYLYGRGIRKAIISKAGNRGFERVRTIMLKDVIEADQPKDNMSMWIMIAILITFVVVIVAFYMAYVTSTVNRSQREVVQPLPIPQVVYGD